MRTSPVVHAPRGDDSIPQQQLSFNISAPRRANPLVALAGAQQHPCGHGPEHWALYPSDARYASCRACGAQSTLDVIRELWPEIPLHVFGLPCPSHTLWALVVDEKRTLRCRICDQHARCGTRPRVGAPSPAQPLATAGERETGPYAAAASTAHAQPGLPLFGVPSWLVTPPCDGCMHADCPDCESPALGFV